MSLFEKMKDKSPMGELKQRAEQVSEEDVRRKLIMLKAQEMKAAQNSLVKFREAYFPDQTDVPPAKFHHSWSNILLNGDKHFVVEAFRESAKTQLVIRANLLHAIAFPNRRRQYIVMICANKWLASNRLKEVSRLLKGDKTGMLSVTIDDYVVDSGDALEVSIKPEYAASTGVKGVRIETYGKGSAVRGLVWGAKRPDLVIIDDPQDAEDSRSEQVTDADWNWFLSDVVFLGQSTRIFMIGNNLGERCIVERAIDLAPQLGFDWQRISVVNEETAEAAWPERFTYADMMAEKDNYAHMGKLDLWYRERMCKCISPESQLFKREDFRYFDPKALDMSRLSIYMTVDPAASEKLSADRTAICVVGVTDEGHWFVLDLWADRKKPSDAMDAIFSMVQKWRPIYVGIESVAFQSAMQDFLTKEMPRRNTYFTIQRLKASHRKEIRVQTSLEPRLKAGALWFPQGVPWISDLENELLSFPHGIHDDTIDALAYIEQIASTPAIIKRSDMQPAFYEIR